MRIRQQVSNEVKVENMMLQAKRYHVPTKVAVKKIDEINKKFQV